MNPSSPIVRILCCVWILAAQSDANAQGSVKRLVTYGGPVGGNDRVAAIAVDGRGDVYAVGRSSNGTNEDLAIIKFAPEGGHLWTRVVDGYTQRDYSGIATTLDAFDNVVVAGSIYGGPESGRDIVVIKYAPDGQQLWARSYNAPGERDEFFRDELAVSLAIDQTANVYLLGRAYRSFDCEDWTVLKYDDQGNVLWTNRFSAYGDPELGAMALDNSGNVYVVGSLPIDPHADDGPDEYVILKIDANGQGVWTNRWRDAVVDHPEAKAVALDKAGNIYITGRAHTLKYAPDGTLLWFRPFPGSEAIAVTSASSDRILVMGVSSDRDNSIVTVGMTTDGSAVWTNRHRTDFDTAYPIGIIPDGLGTVYVVANTRFVHEETGDQSSRVVAIRYTSHGERLSEVHVAGLWWPYSTGATAFTLDLAGRLYVAGGESYYAGPADIWLYRYDPPFWPALNIGRTATHILLSWPALATNVVLESLTSFGGSPDWRAVNQGHGVFGKWHTVTNRLEDAARFYRLRSQ